jgi:predicted glycosyltransferase
MEAEEYIRKEIPTMVGEKEYVSSMKLTTLVALLNGFSSQRKKEKEREEKEAMIRFRNELLLKLATNPAIVNTEEDPTTIAQNLIYQVDEIMEALKNNCATKTKLNDF